MWTLAVADALARTMKKTVHVTVGRRRCSACPMPSRRPSHRPRLRRGRLRRIGPGRGRERRQVRRGRLEVTGPQKGRAMPIYEIEQYELHVMKYRVEGDDEADAIAKLYKGQADPIDNSLEFVEIAEDQGMSVFGEEDLAAQLWDRGIIDSSDTVIPSIRTVERVE